MSRDCVFCVDIGIHTLQIIRPQLFAFQNLIVYSQLDGFDLVELVNIELDADSLEYEVCQGKACLFTAQKPVFMTRLHNDGRMLRFWCCDGEDDEQTPVATACMRVKSASDDVQNPSTNPNTIPIVNEQGILQLYSSNECIAQLTIAVTIMQTSPSIINMGLGNGTSSEIVTTLKQERSIQTSGINTDQLLIDPWNKVGVYCQFTVTVKSSQKNKNSVQQCLQPDQRDSSSQTTYRHRPVLPDSYSTHFAPDIHSFAQQHHHSQTAKSTIQPNAQRDNNNNNNNNNHKFSADNTERSIQVFENLLQKLLSADVRGYPHLSSIKSALTSVVDDGKRLNEPDKRSIKARKRHEHCYLTDSYYWAYGTASHNYNAIRTLRKKQNADKPPLVIRYNRATEYRELYVRTKQHVLGKYTPARHPAVSTKPPSNLCHDSNRRRSTGVNTDNNKHSVGEIGVQTSLALILPSNDFANVDKDEVETNGDVQRKFGVVDGPGVLPNEDKPLSTPIAGTQPVIQQQSTTTKQCSLPNVPNRKSIWRSRRQSTMLSEALDQSIDGMMRISESRHDDYSDEDFSDEPEESEASSSQSSSNKSQQTVKSRASAKSGILAQAVDLVKASTGSNVEKIPLEAVSPTSTASTQSVIEEALANPNTDGSSAESVKSVKTESSARSNKSSTKPVSGRQSVSTARSKSSSGRSKGKSNVMAQLREDLAQLQDASDPVAVYLENLRSQRQHGWQSNKSVHTESVSSYEPSEL